MIPAIFPATAFPVAAGSATRSTMQSETFRDIFNDSVMPAGVIGVLPEVAMQIGSTTDIPPVDVSASLSGPAIAAPDTANPALASEGKSDATSDEPIGDSNARMTHLTEVAPELSVVSQPPTAKRSDDDAPQPTGSAAAALMSGRTEQRPPLSKSPQKTANDAPPAAKNQTTPARRAAAPPTLDIMSTFATVAAPAPVRQFHPVHPPATAPDLRQLYVTPDNAWIETLRSEIVSSCARDNQLQFTLKPEHLGRLDIVLTTQDGNVDIWFDASTSAATQILATERAQLIDDLRQAGVKVGQFEMTNNQNGARQQQRHQQDAATSDPQPTQNRNTLSIEKRGRFA